MNTKIDWEKICFILTTPFTFFVVYGIGEAANIAAIAIAKSDNYAIVKVGWCIGFLCGWACTYFLVVRLWKRRFRETLELLVQTIVLLQARAGRRVEGDEWKNDE